MTTSFLKRNGKRNGVIKQNQMGAGSSVNLTAPSSVVSFNDEELNIIIESFFSFYNSAICEDGNLLAFKWNFDRFETDIPGEVILPTQQPNDTIEQKIRAEYYRSIASIHPLKVYQHMCEYISSGILSISDSEEYAILLSILNCNKSHIEKLISDAELLNLDSRDGAFDIEYDDGSLGIQLAEVNIRLIKQEIGSSQLIVGNRVVGNYGGKGGWRPGAIHEVRPDGTYDIQYDDGDIETQVAADLVRELDDDLNGPKTSYLVDGVAVVANSNFNGQWSFGKIRKVRSRGNISTISLTSTQEELLVAATKRLDDTFGFNQKANLLRYNSFPNHVQTKLFFSLDGHHFEEEARKVLIAYYLIFRGRLLPLILDLKSKILSWAKAYDEKRISATPSNPAEPPPAPSAVLGVSLRFLKEFIASNKIPSDMTTAHVVSDVIVPNTVSTKETYINAHLLSKPHHISDLRKKYNKNKHVITVLGNGMYSTLDGFNCFLSHAWSMPFSELVNIAEQAANVHFKNQTDLLTRIVTTEDILDSSFFWIDVFCKNQHIPAPAMEEFHKALKAPEVAVIALFPQNPIALQRIWCLFEIWTAVVNNIKILPTMSDEAFNHFGAAAKANFDSKSKLRVPVPAGDTRTIALRKTVTEEFRSAFIEEMKQKLVVRVEDSKATVPADIDTIMGLINKSTTVGQLNEDIFNAICETMWIRLENEYGYSKVIDRP